MRFEKLNDNKIRITLTNQDLITKNVDFHSFMSNPIESQSLFLEMLNEAEKEIGFNTKNYNLKLEAIQIPGGDFILVVTRTSPDSLASLNTKKKLHIRRKQNTINSNTIYCFNTFDDFCSCINFINSTYSYKILEDQSFLNTIAKQITLYEYKNNYYLIFSNSNINSKYSSHLYNSISEFGTYICNPNVFKHNLSENGKIIMKNNAIKTAIQYFC